VNKDRSSNKNLIQQITAGNSFGVVLLLQFAIHLCVYLAAFLKLIIIEAGGYYDTGAIAFVGITVGSMPLFAIAMWLIKHNENISSSVKFWGYFINSLTLIWSLFVIKVSYFM
jgi:hypothetical protein